MKLIEQGEGVGKAGVFVRVPVRVLVESMGRAVEVYVGVLVRVGELV